MKRCSVELYGELKQRGAAIVLVWHDELVVEAPTASASNVAALVGKRMKQIAESIVPAVKFRANVKDRKDSGR